MKKTLSGILIAIIFLGIGWCSIQMAAPQNEPIIYPKGKSYTQEWEAVDSLIRAGLPKSAKEQVDKILQEATATQNYEQMVKCEINLMMLVMSTSEEPMEQNIERLREHIKTATYPNRPVFQSVLAQYYYLYYQRNRYKFYNRTQRDDAASEDIRFWSLDQLLQAISNEYQNSLTNRDSLKRTPVETFEALYSHPTENRNLRPTLFDLLAQRAISYYLLSDYNITEPLAVFELTGQEDFAPNNDFTDITYTTPDSNAKLFYAIELLQDLTRFHEDDKDPAALIDVTLQRLNFVKTHSKHFDKDSLYHKALQDLIDEYKEHPSTAEVIYYLAKSFKEQGDAYEPNSNPVNRWHKKKAFDLCQGAIDKFPESYGATLCKDLQAQLKWKSLKYHTANIIQPDKPNLVMIEYQNLQKLYCKIVELKDDEFLSRNFSYVELDYIRKRTAVKAWELTLDDPGDYMEHRNEIKVDALPMGNYYLFIGTDKELQVQNEAYAHRLYTVSNLSFIHSTNGKTGPEIYVMHNETGHPLQDVKVALWQEDYNKRPYKLEKISSGTTDANGHVNLPVNTHHWRNYVTLELGKDKVFSEQNIGNYGSSYTPKMQPKTFFFTDRSIYRPGQTVYFKGVMLHTDGKQNELMPNQKTTVTLRDVNYQDVATLDLSTNEYGSFSGNFVLPMGKINGNMTLRNNSGSANFSVEAYKRPQFEVSFEPVKGSYKLNSNVSVTGKAKSFAGAAIDGAKVKYRVNRNAVYWPWMWYYRSMPSSGSREISQGEIETKADGTFTINFTALADEHNNDRGYFQYTVSADVTDISGETHSTSTIISVGKVAMQLQVNLPEQIRREAKDTFKITASNLNGQPQPAKGNIKVYRIEAPQKLLRPTLWHEQPDLFGMDRKTYEQHFPLDPYQDEDNPRNWKRGALAFETSFNTTKTKDLVLGNLSKWELGWYEIEASAVDSFGETVKTEKRFMVYSSDGKALPNTQMDWFTTVDGEADPGEKASFLIGSAASDVKVFYQLEHPDNTVDRKWLTLNKEQQLIEIPVEEKDRGGIAVQFIFVKHNRVFIHSERVLVPYKNKKLELEFATFRDKLYPGQKEKWTVTIKGPDGEKAAAEMLAAMYDASLDELKYHGWNFNINYMNYTKHRWERSGDFGASQARLRGDNWNEYYMVRDHHYEDINIYGQMERLRYGSYGYDMLNGAGGGRALMATESINLADGDYAGVAETGEELEDAPDEVAFEPMVNSPSGVTDKNDQYFANQRKEKNGKDHGGLKEVKARTNFNETAFFFPHLRTNEQGELTIEFEIPESLTTWKFMGFAYTKDLKTGWLNEKTVTQKELMVFPNAPRFFREGDQLVLKTKINNLSEKAMQGEAMLNLFDATTMQPLSMGMITSTAVVPFEAAKGQSAVVQWQIKVPDGLQAVTYKVVAKSGNFSDGEEKPLPVLTNRMMVTEALPLPVRGKTTKQFELKKLVNSGSENSTLNNHRLTLEFTANPAWYAVQALPYLMEYPYECAEQVFSRFYANSMATHIANSNPRIQRVFQNWKNTNPEALLSNLEKNQELKALLLEETPWVLDAKSETEQKKRIGLLFDLNQMAMQEEAALDKLEDMQLGSGAWPWFQGMRPSRYITQHIVTGMGHLQHLGIASIQQERATRSMLRKAYSYLDSELTYDYEQLKRSKVNMDENHLSRLHIQYLYARSYFKDQPIDKQHQKAYDYYVGQAKKYWLQQDRYMQGMIALALHRHGDKETSAQIIKSLKEQAIQHEEMGMYWNDSYGYFWYQANIERQALLIEVFDEVAKDEASVEAMKVWLLKQKQTQNWKTTKATAEACYALLLRGTDILTEVEQPDIFLGQLAVKPDQDGAQPEAGTGYFKKTWAASEIKPDMGKVKVVKKEAGVAWGALYWQYFEQLDKITPPEGQAMPVEIKKALYKENMTSSGPQLQAIKEGTLLEPGDKIKVRVELKVDRNLEYVHMKDMRAAGFEPINVISRYRYQDGLGYYESTKDAATNFFFDYLPKGTYVFEYPLRVNVEGNFSNGITTIQCMYAPEFAYHSEGIRVKVGK